MLRFLSKEKLVSRISMKIMIFTAAALVIILAACKAEPFYEPTATPIPDEPASGPQEVAQGGSSEGETEGSNEGSTSFDLLGGASEEDVNTTSSGLQYVLLEQGDGAMPESGELVSVHYTGWLDDGTVFDSSVERGTPFQFPLGQGVVIAGWDEGIALLNEGGRARLIIPSELGYGEAGSSGLIPPGATLVFDVELIEIVPGSPDSPHEVSDGQYTETESGLRYFDIEPGEGGPPEEGQVAFLNFTAWLEDGTKLGSTLDSGQPIPYVLGSGELFPGFEEGISSMQMGTIRQMVFPPELAYGESGSSGGQIPPNATLIFEVEVLEIQ
jgi:peptidylprolyl isomerase